MPWGLFTLCFTHFFLFQRDRLPDEHPGDDPNERKEQHPDNEPAQSESSHTLAHEIRVPVVQQGQREQRDQEGGTAGNGKSQLTPHQLTKEGVAMDVFGEWFGVGHG